MSTNETYSLNDEYRADFDNRGQDSKQDREFAEYSSSQVHNQVYNQVQNVDSDDNTYYYNDKSSNPSLFAQSLEHRGMNIGNIIFAHLSRGAALTIMATLAAVGIFLIVQAWPVIIDPSLRFDAKGYPHGANILQIIGPLLFGTILASLIAMVIAVPISVAIALFISHYAPRSIASILGYIVDLLAAIPSVVFGLWGGKWLIPQLVPFYQWLGDHMGWIPLFAPPVSHNGHVLLSVSLILALMILPIITAVSREVFLQAPRLYEEAALSLGATRWEMIRVAVLPFGRSGIISASMLGLGRALGETMAVVMVLSAGNTYSFDILQDARHSTIASNIASQFGEAFGNNRAMLIATGLVLFIITMIVNMLARAVIARNISQN